MLKKGRQNIEIKTLFQRNILDQIKNTYEKEGISAAIKSYQQQRKPNQTTYQFTEKDLETLAYQLIDSNRITDAEKLLETNLSYYPNSERAKVALANAYIRNGKKEKANQLYQSVKEVNPSNYYLNLFRPKQNIVTFRIKGMQGAETIALAGTFNNYDPKANLFVKKDGEWICTLNIPSGKYAYKLYVDNTCWIQDPANQMHIKPNEWWDSYLQVQ